MSFSRQRYLVVRLSNSKSPRIINTLLGILADSNNADVWMVSILLLISNSSSFFIRNLWAIPSAPTIICITINFIILITTFIIIICVVFTPVRWWSSTWVWVTASLLRSPGLFSVFWPIPIMLLSGWSWSFVWFPVHLVPILSLWEPL